MQTTDPIEIGADVTTSDPLGAVLLVVGIVIMVWTMGVMGFLSAGALLDVVGRPFE